MSSASMRLQLPNGGLARGRFEEALPEGIDIFFDLVRGKILDAALTQMKLGGRIPSAGMVSSTTCRTTSATD